MMKATIIEKTQMTLVGFNFFGDPFQLSQEWTEENEIGRLWKRFIGFFEKNRLKIKHPTNNQICYEIHFENEESKLKGYFDIFVGLEVEKLDEVPLELLIKILPTTKYAVFTLEGDQIMSDWPKMIYQEWLPDSGYQIAYPYNIQVYDQRFKGLDNLAVSAIDVYVPVSE